MLVWATHKVYSLSITYVWSDPIQILHSPITQNAWATHKVYTLPSYKMPEPHTKSTLPHHTKCLSPTQSTPSHHIPSKCISISSPSTPRSSKMSPHQNPVCIPLLHTCHTLYHSHPSTFESPDLKIHSLSITNHETPHYAVFSILLSLLPLRSEYLPRHPILGPLSLWPSLNARDQVSHPHKWKMPKSTTSSSSSSSNILIFFEMLLS